MHRRGNVLLAILSLLLFGCATTVDRGVCGRFEQDRQALRYDTFYRYSEQDSRAAAANFKAPPNAKNHSVRWYTLRLNVTEIRPCEHLYLYKELYLQRGPAENVTFEETREFFTAAGKPIATKKENLTAQLKASGYYSAAVPLPIPESAPSGAYRVVSRLVLKTGTREVTLSTATAEFRVR